MKTKLNINRALMHFGFLLFQVIYFIKLHLLFAGNKVFSDTSVPILTLNDAISTGIIKNRLDIDMGVGITKDREPSTMFLHMMRNIRKVRGNTSIIRRFVHRARPRFVTVSAVEGGDTLTIANIGTISGAAAVGKRFILKLMGITPGAGESIDVICVAKPASNKIQIDTNDSTKSLPAIPVNTKIMIIGTSFPQGTEPEDPINTKVSIVEQPTQIFKNNWKVTKTAANERLYGGESERALRRSENERDHSEDLELSGLFNGAAVYIESDDTSNVHRGTFEGLEYNMINRSGNVYAYNTFDENLFKQLIFRVGKPLRIDGKQTSRVCIMNEAAMNMFWEKNQETMSTFTETTIFGQKVMSAQYATLKLDFVLHPLVCQKYDDLNKPYMMLWHPRYSEEVPMNGRDTFLHANVQAPRADAIEDYLLTETTFIHTLPEINGICIPN